MRARLQLTLAAVFVMTLMAGDWRNAAAAPSKTLVFEGTVISIGTVAHDFKPWLITVKVTKIVSGEFSGSTFEFLVHSPVRSGLAKGRSYTIEAVWKDGGYTVDENQWRRPKRFQIGARSAWIYTNGEQNSRDLTGRLLFVAPPSLPRASAYGLSPGLGSAGPLGRFC